VKPTDLAVWREIQSCPFNILHICDYEGGYDNLSPFLDYPGHIVNCSLQVGDWQLTPMEASGFFGRPFLGGMDRHGPIASGNVDEVRRAARVVLAEAPTRFMLGADCTVAAKAPWERLKAAIDTAHGYRR
jgi:uroporphyrinogen decarboxylase